MSPSIPLLLRSAIFLVILSIVICKILFSFQVMKNQKEKQANLWKVPDRQKKAYKEQILFSNDAGDKSPIREMKIIIYQTVYMNKIKLKHKTSDLSHFQSVLELINQEQKNQPIQTSKNMLQQLIDTMKDNFAQVTSRYLQKEKEPQNIEKTLLQENMKGRNKMKLLLIRILRWKEENDHEREQIRLMLQNFGSLIKFMKEGVMGEVERRIDQLSNEKRIVEEQNQKLRIQENELVKQKEREVIFYKGELEKVNEYYLMTKMEVENLTRKNSELESIIKKLTNEKSYKTDLEPSDIHSIKQKGEVAKEEKTNFKVKKMRTFDPAFNTNKRNKQTLEDQGTSLTSKVDSLESLKLKIKNFKRQLQQGRRIKQI